MKKFAKEWNNDLYENIKIDIMALINDLRSEMNVVVKEDVYGKGVAAINGKSYFSWTGIAKTHSLDILDYRADK